VRAANPELVSLSGHQRAYVCIALLALVDAEGRWTPKGPAPDARVSPSRSLDPDGRAMLAVCWAIWEGSSTLSLNELLELSPPRLEAVGELLAAIARGPAAIDGWLGRYAPTAAPPARRLEDAASRRAKQLGR
jgi:hypothetical protein